MQSFDHNKLSSILQLTKVKSRGLQKIQKYFHGTTNFVLNLLLLACVVPIIFVLYSKDLLVVVLPVFILHVSAYLLSHHHSYDNS